MNFLDGILIVIGALIGIAVVAMSAMGIAYFSYSYVTHLHRKYNNKTWAKGTWSDFISLFIECQGFRETYGSWLSYDIKEDYSKQKLYPDTLFEYDFRSGMIRINGDDMILSVVDYFKVMFFMMRFYWKNNRKIPAPIPKENAWKRR